jgi:hypothetical protein
MEPAIKEPSEERRKKSRFSICRDLRYKLVEGDEVLAQGMGETINIGSRGVWFISGQPLLPGAFVELSINWPVLLEDNTRMRLVVFGRLLRSSDYAAACTVDKYEFRTQARTLNVGAQVRRDSMLLRWVGEARKEALKARGEAPGDPCGAGNLARGRLSAGSAA